ncbi:hypothetical protein V7S43_009824 [Phytophthora oleae]|uniref:WRKY19-like zinc finger domain-containing protein n=1 Tax=Phytophthora oleae TaxID=2107226 RepID=A0ABD3FH61_9STRA
MLSASVNTLDASWPSSGASIKGSLGFIMNAAEAISSESQWLIHPWQSERATLTSSLSPADSGANPSTPVTVSAKQDVQSQPKVRRTLSYAEKRRSRECKVAGCEKYIINKGLCFRHGGGKKCSFADCQSSAKNAGLCWRHGGSVKCIVEGCRRRGKSRGLCWAHGGGTKCSSARCTKVAVSNGCCWAHGGGKRCAYSGCKKAAYERTHNYCVKHHDQLKDGNEVLDL